MTHSNVPNKVIGHFMRAQGHRLLNKLKHFEKPKPSYGHGWLNWERDGDSHNTTYINAEKGNLPFAEYRFWIGSKYTASTSCRCRCCGGYLSYWDLKGDPIAARKNHLEYHGCSVRLVKAYKLLLEDGHCTVCGKRSRKSKWGVPLCSAECQRKFMFDDRTDALNAALAEVTASDLESRKGDKHETAHVKTDEESRARMEQNWSPTNTSGTFSGDYPDACWD